MIAYLDASIILRIVLRQPAPLAGWRKLKHAVASALTEVECLRTLDRLVQLHQLTEEELAPRRVAVYELLESVEVVSIGSPVLRRASQSFPAPLGTLDALHLATAMSWRDTRGEEMVFATHDRALAIAARATGFSVVGV